MSDLYLIPGESLILTTNRISVNFIPFELMLTNLRLILLDSVFNRIQPQVIPLVDIFSVNGGTISTGEPIIRITITDLEGDGSAVPIDFIFSESRNQKRKSERDAWLRTLMEKLVAVRQEMILHGIEPSDREAELPALNRWIAPEILHRVPFVTGPEHDEGAKEISAEPVLPARGEKNRETGNAGRGREPSAEQEEPEALEDEARPISVKKTGPIDLPIPHTGMTVPGENILPAPVATPEREPEPVRLESLPQEAPGEVPDVSSGEAASPDAITSPGVPDEVPAESEKGPASSDGTVSRFETDESSTPQTKKPGSVPAPVLKDGEVEKSYPSQESVPAIAPSPQEVNWPVIKKDGFPILTGSPDKMHPPQGFSSSPDARESKSPGYRSPDESQGVPDQKEKSLTIPVNKEHEEGLRERIQSPVETGPRTALIKQIPGGTTAGSGHTGGTPEAAVTGGSKSRRNILLISIVVFLGILLMIAAFAFLPVNIAADTTHEPLIQVTPAMTVNETPAVSTVIIPKAGVWIRVIYPGNYYGRVGNPSDISDIVGTGDQFYFIRNSGRLVQADIQKKDNSGDTLLVELYNNGKQVFSSSVRTPMGTVHFLIDPVTGKSPV